MRPTGVLAGRPLLALLSLLLVAPCGAALAAAPAAALPAGRAALDSLAGLLPEGPVTVEILAPRYTRRIEGLAARMQASARRNPGWFQAYTRRFPSPPLPWHPNLGITRAEYEEYLAGSKGAPMAVTQRATLRFERESGRRRWRLHGWGKLAPLDGLLIDLERNAVEGRRGPMPGLGLAAPDEGSDSPLAWRWYGVWKAAHRSGNAQSGGQAMSASLHIGPLGDGRTTALYWTYRRYNNGARLDDEFLLLRFERSR